jgi:hypothetical protein
MTSPKWGLPRCPCAPLRTAANPARRGPCAPCITCAGSATATQCGHLPRWFALARLRAARGRSTGAHGVSITYLRWHKHGDAAIRFKFEVIDGHRRCAGCNVAHPVESYGVDRRQKSGRNIYCRNCLRLKLHKRRALMKGAFVENVSIDDLMERDGWTCALCDEAIDPLLRHPAPLSASVDHRIPLAMGLAAGGEHSMSNCQAAHLVCNLRKGKRLVA